ncbi:trefoil factor 1 isoform X3 [Ochotona curzoniae]|uniref:trefoil factor 1 isoform X3 n=1 Tax=Ochotona curzoniae TaxID=130825 RepID=UPI001B352498|nr:trefoil factor 1 isoform X3 [Ochotona curzoniae]
MVMAGAAAQQGGRRAPGWCGSPQSPQQEPRPKGDGLSGETCTMTPQERVNCGFPGVTESECKSKGCCFNSDITGFPWCFYPVAVDNPVEEECPF